MFLESKQLLIEKNKELQLLRSNWTSVPGLALVWVGDDPETAAFVRAKQKKAKELTCEFVLHRFPSITNQQLAAVLNSLNVRKNVHGIVLQLPLPQNTDTEQAILGVDLQKDVDGLRPNSQIPAPTAQGIVELLEHNQIKLDQLKTVILGDGRLVGHPLAKIFKSKNWRFTQFSTNAEKHQDQIKTYDLLISATGRAGLVTPAMIHQDMIVVDGSGVDVEVERIEPLVATITPPKGAIGPLTVCNLFKNLLIKPR